MPKRKEPSSSLTLFKEMCDLMFEIAEKDDDCQNNKSNYLNKHIAKWIYPKEKQYSKRINSTSRQRTHTLPLPPPPAPKPAPKLHQDLSVTDVHFHFTLDILITVKECMQPAGTAEQKDTLKLHVASLDICLPRITILLLEKPDGHQYQRRT